MKLVFINRFFYPDHSATSQMLSDLAFSLAEDESMEVSVVTSQQRYDDPNAELPPFEKVKNVKVIRVKTPRFGRKSLLGRLVDYLGFYISASWALFRNTDKNTIVIAKTDPPLISIPAALICKIRGARLINWLQDLFPEVAIALDVKGLQGYLGSILIKLRNWSLNRASKNIVINQKMNNLLQRKGIHKDKITTIHNWTDDTQIVPINADSNPLRETWGIKEKFVVGYSGNFGRAHDFNTLLSSIKQLKDHDDLIFLLIGSGAQEQWIRKEIKSSQLSNILLMPYQERKELKYTLSTPDIHIATLKPELEGLIMPSKVYGILAAGRPMIFIGSTNGEVASILRKNNIGESIEPGDSNGLSLLIQKYKNEGRSQGKGEMARQTLDENFKMESSLNDWKQAITSIYKTDK